MSRVQFENFGYQLDFLKDKLEFIQFILKVDIIHIEYFWRETFSRVLFKGA